ncbi:XrtA/PEP-CTERM system histidine kinase PrsK [Horticoccus sp. 23ND18S-11]|uniref:XrtA/PEP-CTERM system histidine kinase PrsK n=1 Tax=Horticoccus sp. 23ND18S-11 TaxID=3391832 RepID=UPI0039C93313
MPIAVYLHYAGAVSSGAVALATVVRAGRSLPRWAFAVGMLLLCAESVLIALGQSTTSPAAVLRWESWRLTVMASLPSVWALFSVCYARGRELRLKVSTRISLVVAGVIPLSLAFGFREQLALSVKSSAIEGQWLVLTGWAGNALWVVLLVCSVWIVVNLERTFRASVGTMRWRIKFMLLSVGLLFVVRIYTSSQALLYRGQDTSLEILNTGALFVASLLTLRSLFRSGHFELAVYPSQTVLQNSLTILIAGSYLIIVGVLAKVVTYLGGDAAFAPKAFIVLVALVVLTIFLQSDRARLQLRQFVSRNFHRSPYDYRTLWKTFTEGTASRVDQADLCRGLVKMTAEVFQALSVSIWLIDEKKESLMPAASTTGPVASASAELPAVEVAALIKYFHEHPEPVDIDAAQEPWAELLRQVHPQQFANSGHRVAVGILGRGELLGIMVIGDRVAGVSFSIEDYDMLKCIADHTAASLLNVQLSTRLVQAKELEAFQAMAAFFVHDLKNAASTLNLMLQNLPIHYADPEFRADALRGIAKTVSHINGLIGRLGMLRHELKVQLVATDLNDVVNQVLTGVERSDKFTLTKQLAGIPLALLDRDQVHKVITNLVLNAIEALPLGGEVRVETREDKGWVMLIVSDNGCGMSPEFLNHSLFRPFQTTKKNGLGIGMFQSKMIVEAHGGRVVVTSTSGQGTTFRIHFRTEATR